MDKLLFLLFYTYRELKQYSHEVNAFNSLPLKQQEEFIVSTLVKNDVAFNAFNDNLDVLEELDVFKFDPNRVLRAAKVCRRL